MQDAGAGTELSDFLHLNGWGRHAHGIHEGIAAAMQDIWEDQSSNTVPSAALQEMIGKVFNNYDPAADPAKHLDSHARIFKDEILRRYGGDLEHFVKAQYQHTQDTLKKKGIDYLVVYRGRTSSSPATKFGVHEPVIMHPANSFSLSYNTAKRFAGQDGHVIAMKVPAERVFSTAMTGLGCLPEHEVVVLNHPENRAVVVPGRDENQSKFWESAKKLRPRKSSVPRHTQDAILHLAKSTNVEASGRSENAKYLLPSKEQRDWFKSPQKTADELSKSVSALGYTPSIIYLDVDFLPAQAGKQLNNIESLSFTRAAAAKLKDYVPIVEVSYITGENKYKTSTTLVHKSWLDNHISYLSRVNPRYLKDTFYIGRDRAIPLGRLRLKAKPATTVNQGR